MREILDLISDLSGISNLKFVGGTSLFLQDVKETISDIDVLVQDLSEISGEFEIIMIEEPIYKFNGRQRAYFIRENIMVDIFVEANTEEVTVIDEYLNCSSINAEIAFYERTLKLDLDPERRSQIIADINYLKTI
ncbi:hypothetical protein PFY12_14475 [Chryseobacterium camelliae]|uniref:Nucleotidyl transferase AbiEii/AbiGii toxin family protein n=1 Tax=Chryseobacterium camelliae TaxID=1265445 RepID=A0ABY7QKQ8_9FLAO|nr:hypothetical protein [Chryseobacterium camelliae]WBV60230.1 hypothetical protein PFY12_14475 [Chryseobacterium camelliae]